ncbi:L,D-transpeptidase [Ferruginibacter albus]|uniref:L,D-transpeptidase n=1 Tax=Ferruginibacter albus TaxID=2875540 RepID=UPI001CC7B71B|nr:L,D-transpeptidase [Ferruginibacter albus]UAY51232.1 L,D-transpeptidase [Ferruginibacter albus]
MRKIITVIGYIFLLLVFAACHQNSTEKKENKASIIIKYHLDPGKNFLKKNSLDSNKTYIVLSINRTDKEHLGLIDSIIIPDTFTNNIQDYFPFPKTVSNLDSINKVIFFSYPTQSFGAYENGKLIYTGATNMGRKSDPTPTGLFYTNWKAEETKSTFNDEWDLKWNFNIENKSGIGWHQYSLPGYPSSHSCMRLSEQDSKYLYSWADQWVLAGKDSIILKGTPVIIFGTYNYSEPKPWLRLVENSNALDISEENLNDVVKPYKEGILFEQNNRRKNADL